jgi:RNA polymerase sigma-70 factor (ECF subfamily)
MTNSDSIGACLRDLMVAAQAGDRAAYSALLTQVAPIVRRIVRRRFGFLSGEDVEDALQEVLLSVHTARATYDGGRPFLPWLMALAHNRSVDAVRRIARRSGREVAVAEYPETFDPAETNTGEDTYGDPEALRAAVAELPKGQRVAIEMLKFREMSLKEAAGASGMSVAALKVAAHRATKALRVALTGRVDRGD